MIRPLLVWTGLMAAAVAFAWTLSRRASEIPESSLPFDAYAVASPVEAVISPIPRTVELDPRQVRLGERLFADPRLSRHDSVSCLDCHDLQTGGVDLKAHSTGVDGRVSPLNTPTVFNVGSLSKLLWSGRFERLEEQLEALIETSPLLDTDWDEILPKLRADPSYVEAFHRAFEQEPSEHTVLRALASYQRSLITPDAPFDRFLRGDAAAIPELAKVGYRKFATYGCISCHQGQHLGGNLFQRFGVIKNYHDDDVIASPDFPEEYFGLYTATGDEDDKFMFRVAGLRNVALTPPYFHDGSAATLEEAVSTMAEYQLGRSLGEEDVRAVVAFLETLTGELQGFGPQQGDGGLRTATPESLASSGAQQGPS